MDLFRIHVPALAGCVLRFSGLQHEMCGATRAEPPERTAVCGDGTTAGVGWGQRSRRMIDDGRNACVRGRGGVVHSADLAGAFARRNTESVLVWSPVHSRGEEPGAAGLTSMMSALTRSICRPCRYMPMAGSTSLVPDHRRDAYSYLTALIGMYARKVSPSTGRVRPGRPCDGTRRPDLATCHGQVAQGGVCLVRRLDAVPPASCARDLLVAAGIKRLNAHAGLPIGCDGLCLRSDGVPIGIHLDEGVSTRRRQLVVLAFRSLRRLPFRRLD